MSEVVTSEAAGTILIIDDTAIDRTLHRQILSKKFDVLTADSGEEGLRLCKERHPDIILLDVVMPGIDGFEVCRNIREFSDVPVIFVTSCQTPEEHLKAYDAGGDDIIVKPVNSELILRKTQQALARSKEKKELVSEKNSFQNMAMNFLSSVGENGILLNFMRSGTVCRDHEQLAEKVVSAISEFGVWCSVMLRHQGGVTVKTFSGPPTELELAVLDKLSTMGRIFEFKNRLAVNYDHITVIINNMPTDQEKAGRVRDNVTILAESAEALIDVVSVRREAGERAEQIQLALGQAVKNISELQVNHNQLLMDIRICLQNFEMEIERSYSFIGTTPVQERAITNTMNTSIDRIMEMLGRATQAEQVNFEELLKLIRGHSAKDDMLFF